MLCDRCVSQSFILSVSTG